MMRFCSKPMKVVFKTQYPVPFRRMILILILSLSSAYYVLDISKKSSHKPVATGMMSISPIVPDLGFIKEAPALTTKELEISPNKTFSELMEAQGFDTETIHNVYESAKDIYNLAKIQAGKGMTIISSEGNDFERLEYSIDPFQTLVVSESDGVMKAELLQRSVETKEVEVGGYIYGSLYASLSRLGEKDELVANYADIFEWDIDFFKDLKEGDSFRIIFEKKYVDGEPHGYGNILAAELTNNGKVYQAIGYMRKGKLEYFSPDGKAMKKAFLAAPLKFSRISAGFSSHRFHPILKRTRPHYGIDYAAPRGTPVRAIGNGRVILAGWAGGAGKAIKIQHDREISTVYCHLSKFAGGIRSGATVSQGQVIGYVGSTGLATGPHLDFRFLRNGKYINFLSLKSPQAEALSSAEVAQFKTVSADVIQQLSTVKMDESSRLASVSSIASNFRVL
jgi:murein DD-endopeptidase MepM/ murein hydrolase activator NlpD